MNRARGLAVAVLIASAALAGCASSEPPSATPTAAEVAERVVQAHGGMGPWNAAASVSYEHTLHFPENPDRPTPTPWVSREVFERTATGRVYQDWTSHGGTIAWDGREVWSTDWVMPNPPKMMPFLVYYGLLAPWALQEPGVVLEETGRDSIPGEGPQEYVTLMARLPRDPARPPRTSYLRIFTEPGSWEVKAVSYNVTYGPMLDQMRIPPGMSEVGPITHVYDEYAVVGGLKLPVRYHTVGPDGSLAGTHDVKDWAFDRPFDEARMRKPANAVVDDARDERQVRS